MVGVDELSTDILVEVICAATDSPQIDGRIWDACGIEPTVGSEIRVAQEDVHARRVLPHCWGGCRGCLCTQTCCTKANCKRSQQEPAKTAKRAISHSTSSTYVACYSCCDSSHIKTAEIRSTRVYRSCQP